MVVYPSSFLPSFPGRKSVGLGAAVLICSLFIGCQDSGLPPSGNVAGDSGAGSETTASEASVPASEEAAAAMDAVAEAYVKLVLELGEHDGDYVDAYYGPAEWREATGGSGWNVKEIAAQAETRLTELRAVELADDVDEIWHLRRRYLERQLESLVSRAGLLGGESLSFDQESEALYDAVAPLLGAEHFEKTLAVLDEKLAAQGFPEGTALERLEAFREGFIIPTDQVDAVFRTSIDECRKRTAARMDLPEGESFTVEYVKDKSWSAYNWYQGQYQSLIQVNLDLPIYIDRAVDLACHEGYPGHHVYNALLEKNLVRDRGWVELSVYPLFSPQSLIAEGSANYGIEMAFPGAQRQAFEAEVLYPMLGLDPAKATVYHEIMELTAQLAYAGNEAARGYLDGTLNAEQAVDWLVNYAAMSRPRAEQRLRFIEKYRSYVINYNLGKDLVRHHVDTLAGDDSDRRWQVFGELLSSPRLPSGLDGAG